MGVYRNLIGGEWVTGANESENRSPADQSDLIGLYAAGDAAQVEQAVLAARAALPGWVDLGPQGRADVLDRAAALILDRKDEIGRLLAREEGKTLPEAIGETVRAAQVLRFFAGEALRVPGEALPSVRPGVDITVTREPVGVVGLITPWNFPIAIPAWKLAPALCYGNTVVLKPADLTPGCAHALVSALVEAGAPAGVVNLVMGPGREVGQALVDHPDVDAISFTGSVGVGRSIAAACARDLKKVQLEMGGRNPMVVMDDTDLDIAVEASLNGAFYSTGQRCTASSRLIVHRGIADAFTNRLAERMSSLIVGDPLAAETQIGPVVSKAQLDSNVSYVDLARQEGCEVIGGTRVNAERDGFFQRPALFTNARNEMRSAREEIFGPCASLVVADDFDHALALANDTEFGLSAGICTGSLAHARAFQRQSAAGMVMVNLPTAGVDYHVPFGGRKGSSWGPREQGRYAAEFYTIVKTGYVRAS